jgi:hypothetical protein
LTADWVLEDLSAKTATEIGHENLRKPHVAAEIEKAQGQAGRARRALPPPAVSPGPATACAARPEPGQTAIMELKEAERARPPAV